MRLGVAQHLPSNTGMTSQYFPRHLRLVLFSACHSLQHHGPAVRRCLDLSGLPIPRVAESVQRSRIQAASGHSRPPESSLCANTRSGTDGLAGGCSLFGPSACVSTPSRCRQARPSILGQSGNARKAEGSAVAKKAARAGGLRSKPSSSGPWPDSLPDHWSPAQLPAHTEHRLLHSGAAKRGQEDLMRVASGDNVLKVLAPHPRKFPPCRRDRLPPPLILVPAPALTSAAGTVPCQVI